MSTAQPPEGVKPPPGDSQADRPEAPGEGMRLQALAAQMQARLQERLQPTALEVLDESYQHAGHAGANGTGYGTHFRVRIRAAAFAGKSRVACHRLVYDSLQDFIDQGVHALAIDAHAA